MQLKIVSFKNKYASAFYELNIEWLEAFFYVEDYDREVLSNPEKYIIAPGGYLFFAIKNKELAGVIEIDQNIKQTHIQSLVVHPKFFKQEIARKLMEFVLNF